MRFQRSLLGVQGWRRKVFVVLWLALATVLVTMCQGASVGNNEVSSKQFKVETRNPRTDVVKERYLRSAHERGSDSSIRDSVGKSGSSSSRDSQIREEEAHFTGRASKNTSERLEFVGTHSGRGGAEEWGGIDDTAKRPRNGSTPASGLQGYDTVPRIMLELYDSHVKNGGNLVPYQADTVRCFPALAVVNELNSGVADSRGYEGRSGRDDASSQIFKFKLKLPEGEHIRNLLLRLHTVVRRKQSPAGFGGRILVSLARCDGPDPETSSELCSDVQLAWKDVYLHSRSWLSFNIMGALGHLQDLNDKLLTLRVQVEKIYQTVGDPGELRVDVSSDVNLLPTVLLYSEQPRAQEAERQKRSLPDIDWDGFEEDVDSEDDWFPASEYDRSGRQAGRRRRTKNACKRKPLRVDFASIGWSDWVIAPTHYEAYQCSGKCFYPLASHLSPTKHAVIQTLMHSKRTERARRACCVPTKLGPISLLYKEDGVMTFKKEYDGMVALECGCR